MERLFLVTRKRTALAALIALFALMAQRPGLAQAPAQADPLKFTAATPVLIGWQVKADKTQDFEDFWTGLRAAIAKTESVELKSVADSLTKIYKVNIDPFPEPNTKAMVVIYLFQLDPPSTTMSYSPVALIYTDPNGLRAALDNPKMPRAEADALYDKFKNSFVSINPMWPLTKIGG
ncbi:MAG TPA: hypothetical protein VFV78_04125 [Vicinamibacterales bacterium]|nr:hypothetical protein [Vicinamibacterales bacterium]